MNELERLRLKLSLGCEVLEDLLAELREHKFEEPEYIIAWVEGKLNAFKSLKKDF